jgi:hypothetical protein
MFFYQRDYRDTDNGCRDALVFNTQTRAWSTMSFEGNAARVFKTCGATRNSDSAPVLGWYDVAGGDGVVYEERSTYQNGDYVDTDSAGNDINVPLALTTQFQVPELGTASHWQGTVLSFDNGLSGRGLPASVGVQYLNEIASSSVATVTAGVAVVRVEPPTDLRRGNRCAIALTHSLATACGFTGISQTVRIGTQFPRR